MRWFNNGDPTPDGIGLSAQVAGSTPDESAETASEQLLTKKPASGEEGGSAGGE